MITSTQNKLVKEWKKLHRKKYRQQLKRFLIEGTHLIEEAYKTNQHIETLIVRNDQEIPGWIDDDAIVIVSEAVFNEISQTETPQGIAAIVHMKEVDMTDVKYVLLIDAIQDPGNLGTIIRTAAAAGFSKVVLGKGTVDVYNDKVIRASQGSIFHIRIEQNDLVNEINQLRANGFSIWGTTLRKAENYIDVNRTDKTAIILGNEGSGVNDTLLELADELVTIPIFGKVESLNVSIAAGILMYYIRN